LVIREEIRQRARPYLRPDGQEISVVDQGCVGKIARDCDCSLRRVEILALQSEVVPLKYERNLGMLGIGGQISLLKSTVGVVGLGGLGGFTCELLARVGVGQLVLIDDDVYDESNLNRQLHSSSEQLGKSKAEVSARRLGSINPSASCEVRTERLQKDNAICFLDGCDLAVDCLDSLNARFQLQDACAKMQIPMVHGAIAGMTGQIMVIRPGDEGLRELYGSAGDAPEQGVELSLGNLGATAAAISAFQVQETVKELTGICQPEGGLLLIDMATGSCERISFG